MIITKKEIINLFNNTLVVKKLELNSTYRSPIFWCVLDNDYDNSVLVKAFNIKAVFEFLKKDVSYGKEYEYKKLPVDGLLAWIYVDGSHEVKIYRFCDDSIKKKYESIGGLL